MTIAVTAATGTLLFGGALVNPPPPTPASPSSTTTIADNHADNRSDNRELWGLAGLAGLLGLAGLARRRNGPTVGAGTAAPDTRGPSPTA
ncbi:WGxxGxxG family protein [Mycobacterium sp. 852002-51163_SCH5372311]|uniref:WGxxGxxG family protein n=1 Tax=Mycobacterium sp. 852002-51163_SCH5372311 TaxID=1834097 RepID=UPI0018D2C5C0|nr:WGxxGxxG family protein [Mycobacterium sp. 852002-51163_SCH5372311]